MKRIKCEQSSFVTNLSENLFFVFSSSNFLLWRGVRLAMLQLIFGLPQFAVRILSCRSAERLTRGLPTNAVHQTFTY
jgi:hypothetical protein